MASITSNSHENHYCFGCFHSFRCNSILEKHAELCKDNDFCKIELPEVGENIKKHDLGSKSLRMNYIIYVDLQCLLVKYATCSKNLNKTYTINEAQHIPHDIQCLFWIIVLILQKFCITEKKIEFKNFVKN